MRSTPAVICAVAAVLVAFVRGQNPAIAGGTTNEAEDGNQVKMTRLVGYMSGGVRSRPTLSAIDWRDWNPISRPLIAEYYSPEEGEEAKELQLEEGPFRAELDWNRGPRVGASDWEALRSSKRSPSCMSKCVNQGQIHPIMCHSLC